MLDRGRSYSSSGTHHPDDSVTLGNGLGIGEGSGQHLQPASTLTPDAMVSLEDRRVAMHSTITYKVLRAMPAALRDQITPRKTQVESMTFPVFWNRGRAGNWPCRFDEEILNIEIKV